MQFWGYKQWRLSMNQEFDEYKEEYSESISSAVSFSGQSHDFFTKRKAENLIEIIRSEMSRHQHPNILDVGCGHGLIHPYLIQNFEDKISLTAVDIASEVIELARKHNPNVRYDSYDGDTLPYQDNTFTLAFAICVVHHVPSEKWASFLKQMQRVVKKDGLVVIMEHNPNNPLTVRIVKNHPFDKNTL